MRYLRHCPICGKRPALVSYTRDRDMFPSLDNLRYVCGTWGHIIAAPWEEANLGEDRNSANLENRARNKWNNMLEESFSNVTHSTIN